MSEKCREPGASAWARPVGCGLTVALTLAFVSSCGGRGDLTTYTNAVGACAGALSAGDCDGPRLPVVTLQRFAWTSRQAPLAMGTTHGRACFLTRVGGAFNSAEDEVQIVADGDEWLLTGTTARGGFVEAAAACVAAEGVTAEVEWHQGQDSIVLQSEVGHACFLTGAFGRFEGGAEVLSVARENGSWQLSGISQQETLGGSARCMSMTSTSEPFGMEFDTPSPRISSADQDGACFLTVLCGDLGAEGDLVETEWNGSAWELRREVGGTRSLRASAACFGQSDGAGVPSAG